MKTYFFLIVLLMLFLCACTAALPQESSVPDGVSKEQEHISKHVSEMHAESSFETSSEASSEAGVIVLPEDSSMQESLEESIEESIEESSEPEEVMTVLIDPGHGFGDVGCTFPDTNIYEKKVVLTLAHKIGAELENYGINVLYTHDGASFLSGPQLDEMASSMGFDHDAFLYKLIKENSGRTERQVAETMDAFHAGLNENHLYGGYERCYYANLLDARQEISLFLSVHINTNTDSDELRGFEMYYCSDTPFAEQSLDAMNCMRDVLRERFTDRKSSLIAYTWDDGNIVNKYVDMPSVLLESGFATTPSEAQDLLNERWQNDFARAIADGIVQFLYGL